MHRSQRIKSFAVQRLILKTRTDCFEHSSGVKLSLIHYLVNDDLREEPNSTSHFVDEVFSEVLVVLCGLRVWVVVEGVVYTGFCCVEVETDLSVNFPWAAFGEVVWAEFSVNSHVVPPGAVSCVILCILEYAFLADVLHDNIKAIEVFPIVHSTVKAIANATWVFDFLLAVWAFPVEISRNHQYFSFKQNMIFFKILNKLQPRRIWIC